MSTGPPASKPAQSPKNKRKTPIPQDADFAATNSHPLLPENPPLSTENGSDPPECTSNLSVNDMAVMEGDMTFDANEPDFYGYTYASSLSDLESLFNSSSGLGWNDLFDPTMAFSLPMTQDQAYDDSINILAHVASRPHFDTTATQLYASSFASNLPLNMQDVGTIVLEPDLQPPPYSAAEINETELLVDAKVLLKHFREFVIPQFGPLPMSSTSPWEILNWNAAVHTHADMTFLQSCNIKHASKANLFAILGCSAHTIAKTQLYPDTMSHEKGLQILDYASRRAKEHMQESLRIETYGSQRAKYKDQLMAIFSLIALAVRAICLTFYPRRLTT